MKNTMSKVIATTLLSFVTFSFAHAAEENASKAEVKKQIQICSKKKQGDWVVYANKGVTFNGTCEPNAEGKLQFTFPAPPAGASAMNAPSAEATTNTATMESAPATETMTAPVNEAPQAIEQPSAAQPTEAPIQAQ